MHSASDFTAPEPPKARLLPEDRDAIIVALIEANRALQLAHTAARLLGDVDLAAYISDLAADTFATMSDVARQCEETQS